MNNIEKISCLIPLYKSKRFLDIIQENIDTHIEQGAEVIVSDRHQLDDTIKILAERYTAVPAVKILSATDEGSWVDNINFLISQSSRKYIRIIPHDDTAPASATDKLVTALEENSDAILAYGMIKAIDLDGQPLPEKDELNQREDPENLQWSLEDALSLFWTGRFAGAFKGVIRRSVIQNNNLYIRKTRTLIHSERAWLFALALSGRFQFVPSVVLYKRYYDDSTHKDWQVSPEITMDVARIMNEYCDTLIADDRDRQIAASNIADNAERLAQFHRNMSGERPAYIPPGL